MLDPMRKENKENGRTIIVNTPSQHLRTHQSGLLETRKFFPRLQTCSKFQGTTLCNNAISS